MKNRDEKPRRKMRMPTMFKNPDDAIEYMEKIQRYEAVRADYTDWWFRCFVDLAEEGKITREEVFAISEECKRQDRGK